jgi:hypothetical protein
MKPRWFGATVVAGAFIVALLPMSANAAALPAPTPLTPTGSATVDQPLFSWSPVVGAARYEIEVALDDQFLTVTDPGEEVPPRSVRGTSYIPTYTYTATAHYWHVRAVATDGTEGDWSPTREFTRRWTNDDEATGVEQAIPSSRVENVRLVSGGGSPAANQIAITWDPVPGAAYYEVQIATSGAFDQPLTGMCRTPHTYLTPYSAGTYVRRVPIGELACDPSPEFLAGADYYVRVRAVDIPTTVDYPFRDPGVVYGLWSDQRDGSGDPAPGPFTFTPSAKTGAAPDDHASTPTTASSIGADVPLLAWEPSSTADSYKVVIALDRDFANRVGAYGTHGAFFMPAESYDDNLAGRSYYWFALPCTGSNPLEDCGTAERTAVNDDAYVGTFHKSSVPVAQPAVSAADGGANVRLTWQDALTAVQSVNPADSPGGVYGYELQFSAASWSQAKKVVTDNLAYATALSPLASGSYRWRVRPLDGQGVPLAWAYGPDFTITGSAAPGASPSPTPTSTTTTPTGPPPVYESPQADEGAAVPMAPEKPGKPSVTRAAKRKLRVRWRESDELGEPVSAYLVYRSVDGTRFKKVRTTTAQKARLKAKPRRTYWFRIVADSDVGQSEPSRTTRFRMKR